MPSDSLRIAAWSGPRNISTAMMRAWENRVDTAVVDEPFYACYLARTGLDHPGRDAVIESQSTDWSTVARMLTGPVPEGKRVFYQKHMAHHLFDDMHGGWLDKLTHIFLIRDPERMLLSLDKVTPDPCLEDTGLPQQLKIFERVQASASESPIVLDAGDVLAAPGEVLAALCRKLDIEFTPRMLSWPAGSRTSDGVWAPHWYGTVLNSTGFAGPSESAQPFSVRLSSVLEDCRAIYEKMYAQRLAIP